MAEDVEKDWFESPKESSDEENDRDLWSIEENGNVENENKSVKKQRKEREAEGEREECEEDDEAAENVIDFSSEEMEVLVREVEKRHEALFGDYKEGESPKSRWLIWQEVAEQVNLVSSTHRNLEQVRVKWFDYKNPTDNIKRKPRKGQQRKTKLHTGMFMKGNKETFQERSMSCLMRRKYKENAPPKKIPIADACNNSDPEMPSSTPLPSRNIQTGLPIRQYPISDSLKNGKEVIVENIPVTDLEPIILKDGNTIMKILPLSKKRIMEITKDKKKEVLEKKKIEQTVDRWIDNMERELKLQKMRRVCEKDGKQLTIQPPEEVSSVEGEGGLRKKEVVGTLADLEKLLKEGARGCMKVGEAEGRTCLGSPEERFKNGSCASAVVHPKEGKVLSAEAIPSTSTDSGGNSENDGSSSSPCMRVVNDLVSSVSLSSVDIPSQSLTAVSSAEDSSAASSITTSDKKIEQGSSISTGSAPHDKNSTKKDANIKLKWEQLKIKHPVTGKTVLVTKVFPKGTKVIEDANKKQYVLPCPSFLKDKNTFFKQVIAAKQVLKASSPDDVQELVIKEPLIENEALSKKVLPIKESTVVESSITQKNMCQVSNKVSSEEILIKDPTTGKEICLKKVVPIKENVVADTGIALPILCPSVPSGEMVVKNPITGMDMKVKKMVLNKEALEEKSLLGGGSLNKPTENSLSEGVIPVGTTNNVDKKQTTQSYIVPKQEKIIAPSLTAKQSTNSIGADNNSSSSTKLVMNNGLVVKSTPNQTENEASSWKMVEDVDHLPTTKQVVSNKGILRTSSVVPSTLNQLVKSSASVTFSSPNPALSASVANHSIEPESDANSIPLINIPEEFTKIAPNSGLVSTPIVVTPVSLQPAKITVPINVVKCPSGAVPVNIANQPSTIKTAVAVNISSNPSAVKTLIPVDIANHPSAVKNAKPINIIIHPSTVSDDKSTAVKNIVALHPAELGSLLEFKKSENIVINGAVTGNGGTIVGVDDRTEELSGKQVVVAKFQLAPTESSSNDIVIKDPITGKNITIKKLTMAKDDKLVTALLKRAIQKGTLVGDTTVSSLPTGKLITKIEKVTEENEVLACDTNTAFKNNLPYKSTTEAAKTKIQCAKNLFPASRINADEKSAVPDSAKNRHVIPSSSSAKPKNDIALNSFLVELTGNDVQIKEMPVVKEEIFEDLTSVNLSPQNERNNQDRISVEQHKNEVEFEVAKSIKEEPGAECSSTREEEEMGETSAEVGSNKTYRLTNVTDELIDREVFVLEMGSCGKLISKRFSQDVEAAINKSTGQKEGLRKYQATDEHTGSRDDGSELEVKIKNGSREDPGKSEHGHLSAKHDSSGLSIMTHHPSDIANYVEDSIKFEGKRRRQVKRSCELATVTSHDAKRPKTCMEWRGNEKIGECAPNSEGVERMMEIIHTGTDCESKKAQASIRASRKDTKGMDMPSLDFSMEESAVEAVERSSSVSSTTKHRKTGKEQSSKRENEQLHPLVRAALVGEPLDFEAELIKTDGGVGTRGKEAKKGVEECDMKRLKYVEEGEGKVAIGRNKRRERNRRSQEEEKGVGEEVGTSKENRLSYIKIADSTVGSSAEHQRENDDIPVIGSTSQGTSRSRRKISPLENRSYQMFKQQTPKLEIMKEDFRRKPSAEEKNEIVQINTHGIAQRRTTRRVHPTPKCYSRGGPRRDFVGKEESLEKTASPTVCFLDGKDSVCIKEEVIDID